jgi:hypothetical protein
MGKVKMEGEMNGEAQIKIEGGKVKVKNNESGEPRRTKRGERRRRHENYNEAK